MAKEEKSTKTEPVAQTVTVTATPGESKNYFVMKLPQREDKPGAPMPDATGGLYLSKSKYDGWEKAKGAKVTIEPIF